MATRYASLALYSTSVGKAIVFAETSTGYWGFYNDTSTSQMCNSNDSPLRAACVPTIAKYYCNGWTSSGYTIDSDTQSLISFTSSKSSVVQGKITSSSTTSGKVTIIDEHGTHLGTPNGTDMRFQKSQVIGVRHVSTNTGFVFKGWKVTKSQNSTSAGQLLSNGGSTSGAVTTFPSSYDYAIVFKLASSSVYSVTIEALYDEQCTLSYNANGGSPTPSSQVAQSGTTIKLANAITRTNYQFGGWSIDGLTYAAGANFTITKSVTATAIWTQTITYLIDFDKNNESASGSAIPSVSVTKGNSTILPYPEGWSLDKHIFGYWCESSDGTGISHEAGEIFFPTKSVKLYAIWTKTQGEGAADNWFSTDYVGSTRHSFYQYYYHLLVSTNLPRSIAFSVPTTYQGYGTEITKDGKKTTYQRSTETPTIVSVPADDPSSQNANGASFFYSSASTSPLQCNGWSDYYIPSSDGTNQTFFNYPLDYWEWTAPMVENYDFVGWYTIDRSYFCEHGETYKVPNPKVDFSLCISKERTVTWGTLQKSLNYWGYYYTFTQLAPFKYQSESKSYNFLRLVYKLKTKRITFSPNGGTGTMASQDIPITGGSLNANKFTRTNHVFLGWATSPSGPVVYSDGQTIKPTEDLILYAKWSSLERVVVFNPNGGIASEYFKRVIQGQTYGTLPTCSYTNHEFLGWFTTIDGGTQITPSTIVTASDEHTLFAHWRKTTSSVYLVTFADGSGVNTSKTQTFTCGVSSNLPWIQSGLGWSIPTGMTLDQEKTWTTSFAHGTYFANHATIIDLTDEGETFFLYANWGRKNIVITFDPNGGTISETTREVPYGHQLGTLPLPSFNGKNFKGWFTSPTSGTQISSQTMVTNPVTYYAQWSNGSSNLVSIKYKINFETNGGTISSSYGEAKYIKGIERQLPTASQITRPGYSFGGWFTKSTFDGEPMTSIPSTSMGTKTFFAKWT